jgi:hypothetical protein
MPENFINSTVKIFIIKLLTIWGEGALTVYPLPIGGGSTPSKRAQRINAYIYIKNSGKIFFKILENNVNYYKKCFKKFWKKILKIFKKGNYFSLLLKYNFI